MTEQPQNASNTIIRQLFQPRMLLFIWGGLGTVFVLWMSFSAMIPKGKPGPEKTISRDLLTGEMRNFERAFPPRGMPLTPFQGPDGEVALRDFRGKVVLVNLWATWCPPCVEELPSLDALQASFDFDDFAVVAIAAEPRMAKRGPAFFDRLGIENLVLYADPRLEFAGTALGSIAGLPVSILYDKNGNELGRLQGGADWSSAEAQALIRAAIAGQKLS